MIFHEASKYCYDWIKDQPHVKEESITDWLLYHISKNDSNVYYHSFSRNEESFNGADWEWWILTNDIYSDIAYRFLIQAKKLKPKRDNYPLIAYSNKNGLQIDLLINRAKEKRAMPMYAYYSTYKPDINKQCSQINYIPNELLLWCKSCENGCFLTSAYELKHTVFDCAQRNLTEEELINSAFGLSILDYNINSKMGILDFLKLINNHAISINERYEKSNSSLKEGITHRNDEIPQYVKILIEKRHDNIDWLESEFYRHTRGLSGVAVIDMRTRHGY